MRGVDGGAQGIRETLGNYGSTAVNRTLNSVATISERLAETSHRLDLYTFYFAAVPAFIFGNLMGIASLRPVPKADDPAFFRKTALISCAASAGLFCLSAGFGRVARGCEHLAGRARQMSNHYKID